MGKGASDKVTKKEGEGRGMEQGRKLRDP